MLIWPCICINLIKVAILIDHLWISSNHKIFELLLYGDTTYGATIPPTLFPPPSPFHPEISSRVAGDSGTIEAKHWGVLLWHKGLVHFIRQLCFYIFHWPIPSGSIYYWFSITNSIGYEVPNIINQSSSTWWHFSRWDRLHRAYSFSMQSLPDRSRKGWCRFWLMIVVGDRSF